MQEPYTVKFDGNTISNYETITDSSTGDKKIKISYTHSTHDVTILGSAIVAPKINSGSDVGGNNITTWIIIGGLAAAAVGGGIAVKKIIFPGGKPPDEMSP